MVELSVRSLEGDVASKQRKSSGPSKVDGIGGNRRTTYFWDIQRMVATAAPNVQRRSSVEYRKPEAMSKERAMAVLGLGVKKVTFPQKTVAPIFTTGRKRLAGVCEAE